MSGILRTLAVFGGVVLAAALVLAGGRALAPSNHQLSSGELVFDEEFDGRSLDRSFWSTCFWWAERGCTIASNDELQLYFPRQVAVEGGQATLTALEERVMSPEGESFGHVSGMVSTGPRRTGDDPGFAFTYGRAEARIRVPEGDGLWPAFWLLSADERSRPEIDVVEIYGREPRLARMRLHVRDDVGREVDRGEEWRSPSSLAGGWHTYAVDWRPGELRWFVDGVQRWSVTGRDVPSTPLYLIVNLAVGGLGGGPLGERVLPAQVNIDYVKVYANSDTVVES